MEDDREPLEEFTHIELSSEEDAKKIFGIRGTAVDVGRLANPDSDLEFLITIRFKEVGIATVPLNRKEFRRLLRRIVMALDYDKGLDN